MMTFDRAYFNLGHLDTLSYNNTFVHRLDPRTKLLTTLSFIIIVVSFSKYEVSGLIPFFFFPALFIALGDIPVSFILKKVALVSPFAVLVGIFNPVVDTQTAYVVAGISISAGWLSFLSIVIKFMLAVGSGLLLIATTSFPGICFALRRLGLPQIFVSQLLFLYRYLFVLMDETMKIVRARDLRSFGGRGENMRVFTQIMGVLFIRTVERSDRIYQAMLSRSFQGEIHLPRKFTVTSTDVLFTVLALAAFFFLRTYDISVLFGELVVGKM